MLELNDQLGELQKELSKLKNATDQIAEAKCAAKQVVAACESTSKIAKQIQETIEALQTEASDTIQKIKKDTLDKSKKGLEAIEAISEKINGVLKEISEVDFPSRLDRLDISVSAINIGTQNLMTVCTGVSEKSGKLIAVCDELESKLKTQQKVIVGGFIVVLSVQAVFQFLF